MEVEVEVLTTRPATLKPYAKSKLTQKGVLKRRVLQSWRRVMTSAKPFWTYNTNKTLHKLSVRKKELIEARKKAGKGGLSDTEKQGFEQRRTYENQSYTQSQNKLFEGELDYKRKQYELYWRWVENMGKDVCR